jgi:citrate lyase beta subunit
MFVDFDQYAYTSSYVALAAMSLGIEASGGVFIHNPSGRVDQRDHAIEEAETLHAAGVRQITALHPNFIEPLCNGLAPTADEMSWSQTVLDTYQELTLAGESVTTVGGKVVDIYEYERAVQTLEWGRACEQKDQFKAKALARATGDTTINSR